MGKARLSSDLGLILLWCPFAAANFYFLAQIVRDPIYQSILYSVAGLFVVLMIGLYRTKNWARLSAAVLFSSLTVVNILLIALVGFSTIRVVRVLMGLWAAWYLFSPSTRALFLSSHGVRTDLFGVVALVLLVGVVFALMQAAKALSLPLWIGLVAAIVLLIPTA